VPPGTRRLLVALVLPALLAACSAPVRPAATPTPRPAATPEASFTAPFTGTVKRLPGPGNALTWQIDGSLDGQVKGALQLVLIGHSTQEGLWVDSGQVSVRRTGASSCDGDVSTVTNNVVAAQCGGAGGALTPVSVTFAIGTGDRVTGTVSTTGGTGAPTPSPRPSGAASGGATPGAHVFVIVMENTSYDQALAQPYTAALARQYALATDYHAVAHPSLPNYLAMTAGSTFGIQDDTYRPLPAGGLGAQLTQAGVSWKAYAEGMAGDCLTDTGRYALKHDPFAFYGGACPANIVPMDQLAGDLAGTTPRLSWLIPDLCHDGHDCPAATADGWLAATVPAILASPAWQDGGVLFITWDEDDGESAGNHVAALVVAPRLKSHTTAVAYDHYSLLATVEDRLGVPRLGQAASATPITDVLPG
jgi:hypothetical protein